MGKKGAAVVHYAILAIISVFVLFPYYWMFITSVKPASQILLIPPTWWPSKFEFKNYIDVWDTIPLLQYIKNSMIYSLFTTIFCLILSSCAGYSLSRFNYRFKKASITIFLSSQLVPGVLTIVPFYFMIYNLKLSNTPVAIIFAYSIWAIPFCTLMLRSYFGSAIPVSVEESATIDGCSKFGVFFRIAIPLSLPGIIATGLFAFLLSWNEFMWASIILTKSELKPLAVGMHDYIGQFGITPAITLYMATAVIATLPALIIFGFTQKHLVSGLAAGAEKG
jgi:multiple sugar transport system permease protein